MRDTFVTGRVINMYFYIIESIAAIIIGIVMKNHSPATRIVIGIYLALTIIFMIYVIRKKKLSDMGVAYANSITFSLLSFILSYQFDNVQMFIFAIFVHSFAILLYMDLKIFKFNILISVCGVMLMLVYGITEVVGSFDKLLYCTGAVGTFGTQWMALSLIKTISFQNRRSMEQERSLDDLLRVVEAKCDEARQATKSKSEFLSNMSHEIRTPINAVLGMNEMILRESKDSNVQEYASNVASAGKMLLSLVNDILDFSKIESGRMDIIPVEYKLSAMIYDLCNIIKPKADEKELKLRLQVDENIPNFLNGDEVRIRQILTNILTNAVKYTDYGTVTFIVEYESVDEKNIILKFSVKDTGRGIKGADITHLFDSFQRMDERANRNIEGTGLGLSITKRFVDMMDGTLDVESTYGAGSTFTVALPQAVVKEEPIGDMKHAYSSNKKQIEHYHESFTAPNAKVLVVDDNLINLKVVSNLLKQTKINIETAISGRDCLEKLRTRSFDIVLLDHMMPGMDGLETLKRMKAEQLNVMPVIALTANAISGARDMYMEYGFQDYLSKPITGRELEKMLYNWLPKELIIKDEEIAPREKPVENTSTNIPEVVVNSLSDKEEKLINEKQGIEYCAGNKELYFDVLESFYEQGSRYYKQLKSLYEKKSFAEITSLLYSFRSNCINIGANSLADMCREAESYARNKDMRNLNIIWDTFLDLQAKVLKEIEGML